MSPQKKSVRKREAQAPLIVVLITYLLCWTAGAFLIVSSSPGDWQRLVVAGFLIIWPVSGTSPLEVLRAWRND